MPQTEIGTRISQVGTVMVPVTDQDRALEFYVGTLGFEKRTDTPYGEGARWGEVAPPGAGGARAGWRAPPPAPPGGSPSSGRARTRRPAATRASPSTPTTSTPST